MYMCSLDRETKSSREEKQRERGITKGDIRETKSKGEEKRTAENAQRRDLREEERKVK